MAGQFNRGAFTFNQEELKDWSRIVNELTFGDKELNELFSIEEGIKYDQQIVFASRGGLLGKKVNGCTPNAIDGVTFSEKTWKPVFEDFRLEHCTADQNQQDKLVNQMTRMNPDFYKILEGSQSGQGDFLVASILDRWKESILRKVWLSDTTAADVAGGGDFTNGTDLGFFNTFDGFYKQIFAEIPSGAKNHVAIDKNGGANYQAQELASGDAIATLKAMYNKADSRLLGLQGNKFYVTRSIYDGYMNDLEDIQNQGAGNTMINEEGQMTLRYRGIEVCNVEVVDRAISEFQNDGTKLNIPHRVVLTNPTNLKVGTLAQGDFGELEAFYDMYHKVNVIDGVYSIDVKHMESYLTVAAY
jgi:hypothetical protein